MSKVKWIVLLLLAVAVAAPSYAVELTLGGFPSYFRIRPQFFHKADFDGSIKTNGAACAAVNCDRDDNIFLVDSRLRLTPQLVLSDAVTIRAQVDVMDNVIWGGQNSTLERDVVFESLTPGDRFRGALLAGPVVGDVRFFGLFGAGLAPGGGPFANLRVSRSPVDKAGGTGSNNFVGDDRNQFFNVRMLHVDLVLPNNLGFIRAGRQPFDWGLGILANGGWDPLSDLGFVLDRFLYLKSFPLYKGSFTFVFVSDRLRNGNGFTTTNNPLNTGGGDGWDGGATALIYNQGPFTIGGYVFPYIHQTNFGGTGANLKRLTLYAALIDYKTDFYRGVFEYQGAQGKINNASGLGFKNDITIKATNQVFAGRAEVYPGFPVKLAAVEFGFAGGDKIEPEKDGGNFQGNILAFNAAYNVDNLLYKHIIPTIYGMENSVINSFYARVWATAKVVDKVTFTPQALFGWNQRRQALLPRNFFNTGESNRVRRFQGAELEGTLSVEVVPGVNFDFIGSVVIAGNGLKDLQKQRAAVETNAALNKVQFVPSDFNGARAPFSFQGRLLVYIDQFFKK